MTAPTSEPQELVALRRDLEELRRRVETLEGQRRVLSQRVAFLTGRVNSEEVAS